MSKKIVIVGGVAGGASTAARLRRLDESAQIIILERGPYISFANCGLPYHIGDVIRDRKDLILQTPEEMGKRFNLDIRTLNEALRIHRKEKQVEIVDHRTGRTYMESYDVLVLSPGSSPLKPPIEGIDSEGIFSLWTIPDMDGIIRYIKEKNVRSAIVVGGGFIGIEVAENLHAKGIKVTIAEMLDQVMAPLDYDMAQILHRHITGKGVELILGDGVKNFSRKDGKLTVSFKSGRQETADMAILSIGVSPNGRLASESGLETNRRGGIVTGPDMKTSDESIYAVGDAVEVTDFITGDRTMVPLAGPANKQGRICADNICGLDQEYKGTQGSCVVKVFDLTSATTGLNEKNLDRLGKELNRDYKVTILHPNSHAGYYPGALSMTLKLVFSLEGKVLGAQAVGYEGVDKRMDVIATVIRMNGTVEDLKDLELCYAPPYSSAKDPVNMAGYSAENILKGVVDNILVRELETLEQGTYAVLDVRTPEEYQMGHIEGALNIQLDDLRDRLQEVPAEKLLIVHCAVRFRSYLACRILLHNGFNQVRNLAGGYTTYSIQSCAHAAATDRFTDRGEPEKSDNRINACGLQCPGPIMRLHKELKGLRAGETVEISVTDPGFASDIG
ncbi:MAG: FAD-dependent oxidoreductase, partial [Clostridia bacterium]